MWLPLPFCLFILYIYILYKQGYLDIFEYLTIPLSYYKNESLGSGPNVLARSFEPNILWISHKTLETTKPTPWGFFYYYSFRLLVLVINLFHSKFLEFFFIFIFIFIFKSRFLFFYFFNNLQRIYIYKIHIDYSSNRKLPHCFP